MNRELPTNPQTEQATRVEALFNDAPASMGLQSYEFFEGNGEHRTAQKEAFLKGEIRNPDFDYPLLTQKSLHEHEVILSSSMEELNHTFADEDEDMAYWASIGYRLAEVYFLREAVRLNAGQSNNRNESAARFIEAGHEIYGEPDTAICEAAVVEIWRQIDDKQLDEAGQEIKQELEELLIRPETTETIPMLSPEAFEYYGQMIESYFAGEKFIVEDYWRKVIVPEGREATGFNPDDALEVFRQVNLLRGGEDLGISVEKVDGTSYAFSIAELKLKIGDKHANIKDTIQMFAKVVHEDGIHIGRFRRGLRDGVYVSAYGHYDYLDFEEGMASVFEQIIKKKHEKLSAQNLGHYVHIGLAEGAIDDAKRDFRDVFEIAWRYRLLMSLKKGKEINQETIDETRSKTYDFTIKRIFRGTPSDMPGIDYTKDLTYLRGRIKATNELEANLGNDFKFYRLFAAKYDPTNELHSKVVMKGGNR